MSKTSAPDQKSGQNLFDISSSAQTSTQAPTANAPLEQPKKIWRNIIFMTVTPVLSAILVPLHIWHFGFSWGLIALLGVCFVISNMSITCGYHRYFSHRSYDAHPLIEWLYIFVGAGAFQGSILDWSTDHRRHHRMVDTNDDPYTINKGFMYAHIFWLFHESPHPDAKAYPKDLTKNKWIQFQHDHYVWIASFVGFILPALVAWSIGLGFWGGLIFGGLFRIVLSQHSTFLINSAAHTFGKQTYTDKHTARDSFIMAVLTFGEGYHNFHHTFQADYRNGTRWFHWDPTKWWIKSLSYLGLAKKLKQAQKEEILKARLAMEERLMISKGACVEQVTQMKMQIEEAQKKLKSLRENYLNAKRELGNRSRSWKSMMKAEIRMAKIDFRSAYGKWKTFQRAVKRAYAA